MNIQVGHVARHTPRGAGAQGREAAVADIAQDLLLAHMHQGGLLDGLAMKGGTAIRKLYAGSEGRFSLDLDFAAFGPSTADAGELFVMEADGLSIGPFTYGVTERRGKWSITFGNPFVEDATLASKLDFSPAPWLAPARKGWVPMPVHAQYGFDLPPIRTVRLEENIAEKVARLNRTTTARDMYDLRWLMTSPAVAPSVDRALVRRLAVLKVWVDTNGMHACGRDVLAPGPPGLRVRPGPLAPGAGRGGVRPRGHRRAGSPQADGEGALRRRPREVRVLADLDKDELAIARSDPRDRSLAIRMLSELPGTAFQPRELF